MLLCSFSIVYIFISTYEIDALYSSLHTILVFDKDEINLSDVVKTTEKLLVSYCIYFLF